MHQKHSNISKANFGHFSRNEIAFLGTPCSEIKIFFAKIINQLTQYRFSVIEADHKAEETLEPSQKFTDKINFNRLDSAQNFNVFDRRTFFENTDLTLVNGNHFEAQSQIIFIDSKKTLEKKLEKLTDVRLIILKEDNIPNYILDFFGDNLPPIFKENNEKEILQVIEKQILNSKPNLFGLILSGGKSSRMGRDKAILKYHGQQSQIEYMNELLNPYCQKIFVSTNPNRKILDEKITEKIPAINDTFLDIGPMSGILSAFQQYPNMAWLVVACDMPFLTDLSIAQLVQNRNFGKLATAFRSTENDFPEPLITIWEPKAYPKLLQMLAYGIDCPRKTLINSDIELLENQWPSELQNINTKEEYEKSIIKLSPKIV